MGVVQDSGLVNNPGNFFNGLPIASKSKSKKGRGINFADKDVLEQQKLDNLQSRMAGLDIQMQRQQDRVSRAHQSQLGSDYNRLNM